LKSAGDLPICNYKTRHVRHVQARHIASRARRIQPTAPAREGAGHQFQTQMIAAMCRPARFAGRQRYSHRKLCAP
jgi:hypothetical protein